MIVGVASVDAIRRPHVRTWEGAYTDRCKDTDTRNDTSGDEHTRLGELVLVCVLYHERTTT